MSNLIREIPLFISKSSILNGVMRWSAVNSDTESDLYGEKMSLELYRKMLSYIRAKVPPPEPYKSMVCSEYWCGGMPYLSISHYSDLNGKAVPGQPVELLIDGNQLKAKGILFNNKLGQAVWKSLKADENKLPDEDKIRISIAFLDLAHKHGDDGKVWERKSITDLCPNCAIGEGNKVYVDGYLVHLALTRVPVNPRTQMIVENSMAKNKPQTKKEDAESVLGDKSLAEEIDSVALETKSDVLVEMSDTDVETLDIPVLVEEAKTKKDDDELTAKDVEDSDASDDKGKDKKKEKYANKALTAEDVAEIVKSLMPNFTPVDAVSNQVLDIKAKSEISQPVMEKSALDITVDNLYNHINVALEMKGVTVEQKLESINPALQEMGTAITNLVREQSGEKAPAPVSNDQAMVLEAVSSLAESVKSIATELATMKAQTLVPSNTNRVPVPRSIQPQIQASLTQPAQAVNPMSVKNIVRRSVSQHLPLT